MMERLVRYYQFVQPTNPAEFWTMAYTIATVGLIVVAWRGLRSLKLAKADMLTRSQREARGCAIARCEEFAHDIISKNSDHITRFAAANLPLFVERADVVRFDPDTSEHLAAAQTWLHKMPADLHTDCIHLLNRLEAWSMYFTNGVADHEIAFGPCAPVFCSMIVRYYPILLVRRAGQGSGKFPNAVQLFKTWRAKLEAEQDGVKMQGLIEQMRDLQQRRANQPTLPPPLGVGD
jgi:hypothetical protein